MNGDLRQAVRALDQYELRRLIMFAQGLLKGTDGPTFEPLERTGVTEGESEGRSRRGQSDGDVSYRRQWRRCGKPNCTRCPHGPYWYAYWREEGRSRSRYVGKTLPDGVGPPDAGSEIEPADPNGSGPQRFPRSHDGVTTARREIPEATDDRSR